ncbi:MAG TPA: hypothetical protein VME40_06615 [Caulobacteraceae bacterium]|nr:hypothetical protein [Caulobacteraceae bacterium]
MSDAPPTVDAHTDDALVFEAELEAPPAKVWRALAEPEIRREWLGEAETGPAEVRRADPGERLDLAWPTREGESLISFRVGPAEDGGSRLTIVHQAPRPAVLRLKPRARATMAAAPRWRMAA